jgi:hypothetical protein
LRAAGFLRARLVVFGLPAMTGILPCAARQRNP